MKRLKCRLGWCANVAACLIIRKKSYMHSRLNICSHCKRGCCSLQPCSMKCVWRRILPDTLQRMDPLQRECKVVSTSLVSDWKHAIHDCCFPLLFSWNQEGLAALAMQRSPFVHKTTTHKYTDIADDQYNQSWCTHSFWCVGQNIGSRCV